MRETHTGSTRRIRIQVKPVRARCLAALDGCSECSKDNLAQESWGQSYPRQEVSELTPRSLARKPLRSSLLCSVQLFSNVIG